MRTAFITRLTELAERDERIFMITSDTGFTVFEDFRERFPERFLNIGISESAMIGVSAGLALEGRIVFVYGIVPFVTMRCFEHIRDDLCFQNLPVRVVGVGQGLTYGSEGATHHSIEDIALMSSMPNMTVVCPGDPVEMNLTLDASLAIPGPMYLRLGKKGERTIHESEPAFAIGRGVVVKEGKGVAIVATGNMLDTADVVDGKLRAAGSSPVLVSMHTVKPIDRELIRKLSKTCHTIATIEEHGSVGGLGSQVAEVITTEDLDAKLVRFDVADEYIEFAGSHEHLRAHFGLTPDAISEKLMRVVRERGAD